MKLYGLKNCDTCRKALKVLPNVEFIDVRSDGISSEVLSRALEQFEGKLVNARSTTWRALTEQDRARPAIDLLVENPTLMKRPLIEHDGRLFLGWDKATQAALGIV